MASVHIESLGQRVASARLTGSNFDLIDSVVEQKAYYLLLEAEDESLALK